MSSLGQIDIDMILDLFEGSRGRGYVLEFSDRSFSTLQRWTSMPLVTGRTGTRRGDGFGRSLLPPRSRPS